MTLKISLLNVFKQLNSNEFNYLKNILYLLLDNKKILFLSKNELITLLLETEYDSINYILLSFKLLNLNELLSKINVEIINKLTCYEII